MNKSKTKRLRIFAGPNGSGKSTLAKDLLKKISIGIFVNADEIEKALNLRKYVSLNKYGLRSDTMLIQAHIKENGISTKILNQPDLYQKFEISKNNIYYDGDYHSYIAADIASFIQAQLMLTGKNFSFETVFSHKSKLDVMTKAKEMGYRVYFYFITTEDPSININRVKIRVAQKGHPVPDEKIINRYYRSLDLMFDAVRLSTRAYLFDNSGKYYELVAQVDYGKNVQILDYDKITPVWFKKYLYDKIKV